MEAIEFVGGPRDGELLSVSEPVDEIRIPIAPNLTRALLAAPEEFDPADFALRQGVYRSRRVISDTSHCWLYDWEGEH